jgi:hypothetical protein
MMHEAAQREAVNLSLLSQVTEKVRATQMRGIPPG